MKLLCCFLLLFLILTSPVFAQSFLSLDAISYQPGDAVSFTMYEPDNDFPDEHTCQLTAGGEGETVVAIIIDEAARDQLKSYQLLLPEQLSGLVTLTVLDTDASPVQFLVKKPDGEQGVSTDNQEKYPTLSSLFGLAQPYIDNISAYEPIYFLVGTNPEKSKFQISFKYRPFSSKGTLNKNMSWLQGFHLAYTQTSFWDLKSESTPFQDTSYKPELFFLFSNSSFRPTGLDGLFFILGYQHESNGRAEPESRSTNFLYLKSVFVWYDEKSRIGLGIVPKIWTYIANDNETNEDLSDYRGYFQVDIRAGKAESLLVGADLRWAKEGLSIQTDLSYPMHQFLGDNLEIYLHLQYANSLAESLIDYQNRTEAFRIGISFVR